MSAAAPITESTLFLYSSITSSKCTIDFQAVGAALNLKTGTAAMRYRRLRERIEKQAATKPSAPGTGTVDENTLFLYQCMIASGCKPDWKIVGVATGLKAGTAAMRWRRLQEKIEKDHNMVATTRNTTPRTPTTEAVLKIPKPNVPRKRKAVPAKDDIESDGEKEGKRIKVEEEAAVPDRRQTRGEVLNFTDMLDSRSSGPGTRHAEMGSSLYEDIIAQEGSDGESVASPSEIQMPVRAPAEVKKFIATPQPKKSKATKAAAPTTPASDSHSARDNSKLVPSSLGPQITGISTMPLTPISPDVVESIETEYEDKAAEINRMGSGRIFRMERQSHASKASSNSTQSSESAAAKVSISGSSVKSLHAHDLTDPDSYGQDDMSSVAPDDSISVTAKASQGGLTRKRVVKQNSGTFLGKLWDLFG